MSYTMASRKCHVKNFLYCPDEILIRPDELLYCPDDILVRPDDILIRPDDNTNSSRRITVSSGRIIYHPDDIKKKSSQGTYGPPYYTSVDACIRALRRRLRRRGGGVSGYGMGGYLEEKYRGHPSAVFSCNSRLSWVT